MFSYTVTPERLQIYIGKIKPPLVTELTENAGFEQPIKFDVTSVRYHQVNLSHNDTGTTTVNLHLPLLEAADALINN